MLDGPNAPAFEPAISEFSQLLVPTVVLLEVRRRLLQLSDPPGTSQILATMHAGALVPLDPELALDAAHLGVRHRLPLADSIIYAVGRRFGATVWTQDSDFEGLEGVEYRRKN